MEEIIKINNPESKANSDNDITETESLLNFEDPKDLVNKHVIIKYNGKPYPGLVVDIDEQDVRVMYLHRIGKQNKCHFYWLTRVCMTWRMSLQLFLNQRTRGTNYFVDGKKHFQWLTLVLVAWNYIYNSVSCLVEKNRYFSRLLYFE